MRAATTNPSTYRSRTVNRAGSGMSGVSARSMARRSRRSATSYGNIDRTARTIPGEERLRAATRSERTSGPMPSTAPMTNRRRDEVGSKGWVSASTARARSSISATGAASASARSVGFNPLGCRTNSGSLSSLRSRPSAWLVAEGERLSRAEARPTWRSSSSTFKSTRRFRSARWRSISCSILMKSYQ